MLLVHCILNAHDLCHSLVFRNLSLEEWECKALVEERVLHFRISVRKPHWKIPQGDEIGFDRKEPIFLATMATECVEIDFLTCKWKSKLSIFCVGFVAYCSVLRNLIVLSF